MLSENTSKIGKPDISFTEYKDPDNESVTEKSSPWEPCTVNTGWDEPEPYTINVDPLTVPFEAERYALEAVIFCEILTEPVTITFWLRGLTNDAVKALKVKEEVNAYDAEIAVKALPESDPVNPAVAVTEVKAALEPDMMTFFQLGIYMFITVGYTKYAVPTSLSSL